MKLNNKYLIKSLIACICILLCPLASFGLEELSEEQLDIVTGQAGVTILLTSILIEHQTSEIGLLDTLGGDIKFNEVKLSTELSTRSRGITIDVLEDYGNPMMQLKMSDMGTDFDFETDEIVFNNESIGSAEISDFQVPEFDLSIYADDGSGIDSEIGFQVEVAEFKYTYDTESVIDPKSSLTLTGIMAAEYFDGDALPSYSDTVNPGDTIDTSTWGAQGNFTFGDTNPTNSFSIDLLGDTSPYIEHKFNIDEDGNYNLDSDGRIGTAVGGSEPWITNPRQDSVYIYAGGNISGSFRMTDVEYHDGSTGPAAIDGINGSVYIEAPGRGYGNSWDLPYYDNDN